MSTKRLINLRNVFGRSEYEKNINIKQSFIVWTVSYVSTQLQIRG